MITKVILLSGRGIASIAPMLTVTRMHNVLASVSSQRKILQLARYLKKKDILKRYEYLFTVTGVKKIKLFLSLTRRHFQPRVTEGHEWLEIAPSVK